MSAGTPDAVSELVWGFLDQAHSPAWLQLDEGGRVETRGGSVEAYWEEPPAIGSRAEEVVPALLGLLPASDEITVLPGVNLPGGRQADLLLQRRDGRDWLVLMDTTRESRRRRALQQAANELSLLRYPRGDSAGGPEAFSTASEKIVTALGLATFERNEDGSFRRLTWPPKWFCDVAPEPARAVAAVRLEEHFPFLEVFFYEAEEVWERGGVEELRSGAWTETTPEGGELNLQAIALSLGDRQVLVMRQAGEDHEEHRVILQKARETSLAFTRLNQETAKKEVLLHCIVHDLAGPLTSIRGAFALLGAQDIDEAGKELLEVGLRQTERQERMIRQILETYAADLEASQSFEHDPASAPSARAAASAVVSGLRPAFREVGVDVELDAPGDDEDWLVVGESTRLERIVSNLLENALRHSPAGTTVTVRLEGDDKHGRLHVEDQGPGVPEGLVGSLFNRFSQGSSGQKKGKAGLGLYFAKITSERWGGGVSYQRRESGGSRFTVELLRSQ